MFNFLFLGLTANIINCDKNYIKKEPKKGERKLHKFLFSQCHWIVCLMYALIMKTIRCRGMLFCKPTLSAKAKIEIQVCL